MSKLASEYYQNIHIALDALDSISTVRLALTAISSKMKYNRDIEDVIKVLKSAEKNLELSAEGLNNIDVGEIIKQLKFWKESYGNSLQETRLLSRIIYNKRKVAA